MGKSKKSAPVEAAVKPEKVKTDDLKSVKNGAVVKSSQTPKSKSKDLAKQVAAKASTGVEGKKSSKKAKKEPTPEPSSDESESGSDEGSDASSEESQDDSASEADVESSASDAVSEAAVGAVEKPKSNGVTESNVNNGALQGDAETSESSESSASEDEESDAESDEEEKPKASKSTAAAKAVNGAAKKAGPSKITGDDSAESGSSASESDSSSGSDEEDEEDSSDSEEEAEPAPKKRKAEEAETPVAKKTKVEEDDVPKTNLFVGQLSWNVDDAWLTSEFESFGKLVSARVMTERDTGRSRGFGYVEFETQDDAQKALEAMSGKEIDGRAIKLDLAEKKKPATSTPNFKEREKKYGDREKSAPADTLFIGNLPFGITQDVVWETFKDHGATTIRLPTDRETGEPKGFGYVSFNSIDEATAALEAVNGEHVGGRPVRLDFSGPRPDNGGGRGGRGGGFGDRGGRGGGFGGRGDRGGRGGRGGFDRGGRGGGRGGSTNRGGFSDFKGKKMTF